MNIGANYIENGKCEFTVWAPLINKINLKIFSSNIQCLQMKKNEQGYWNAQASEVFPQDRYIYQIDDCKLFPDPASFYQPDGVHKQSAIIDHSEFIWQDSLFRSCFFSEMIIYELHVGTFTSEGSFESIIPKLKELVQLGVTALQLMPVSQFSGQRNWGYDGVYPFAVQNSYGGPKGLKRLVSAAHEHGLSVILDVVYNHLGPEGNYLSNFAPYCTEKFTTPWGSVINFDGEYSFGVRNFFIQNALYWLKHYHIDGLRLDAIQGIWDMSAKHFLLELKQAVSEFSKKSKREHFVIAESDLNDVRIIENEEKGGYNLDAQWLDDFHHSLHSLLTQEKQGYYADFGSIDNLKHAFQEGLVYTGNYSRFRKANHGSSSKAISPGKFIVYSQNHDQVGNRVQGKRLSSLVDFESLKLSAAAVILSPYVPLIFMGEEYAAGSPFLYFINFSNQDLAKEICKKRKAEFKLGNPDLDIYDPRSLESFVKSKLDWDKLNQKENNVIYQFYQELIKLRKKNKVFSRFERKEQDFWGFEKEKLFFWRRWYNKCEIFCVMNFSEQEEMFSSAPFEGNWKKILDSSDTRWNGNGEILPQLINTEQQLHVLARSFALYEKEVLK